MDRFAIFIPTHGRAMNLTTPSTLVLSGCTSTIYLVVDDMDEQKDLYQHLYPNVLVFNKLRYMNEVDALCSPKNSHSVVFARAFIEDVAKQLGLFSFMMLDDDITKITYRYNKDGQLSTKYVTNLDAILSSYNEFLLRGNISTLSFGTGASYIGGLDCLDHNLKRRCFQLFIRNVSKPVTWISNMNEDYITSVATGKLGALWFEVVNMGIVAKATAKGTQEGGMASYYNSISSFTRAFFSVVSNPSCFTVQQKKDNYIIRCNWDNAVPKIVSNIYKR